MFRIIFLGLVFFPLLSLGACPSISDAQTIIQSQPMEPGTKTPCMFWGCTTYALNASWELNSNGCAFPSPSGCYIPTITALVDPVACTYVDDGSFHHINIRKLSLK